VKKLIILALVAPFILSPERLHAAGATFARTIRQIKNYTTTAIISRAADAARNLTNPRADALPNTLQISQNSPAHLALTGKLDKT